MFLNVRYIHFWYLESHFRNGTWKKHPTFHIAVSTPLTGGAVGAWVSSWQLPIPRWGQQEQTWIKQSWFLNLVYCFCFVFFWWAIGVLSFSGCCMLCCFYFCDNLQTHYQVAEGQSTIERHPVGQLQFLSFWDGLWVYDVFLRNFPKPSPQKKASVFRCFPHGVATQHLHLCLVALDRSRRYLQRGGAAHGTADVAALGGGEKRRPAMWGKYWGKFDLTGD